jgi:hypothetical protein
MSVARVDALLLHEVHDDGVEHGQRERRHADLHALLRGGGPAVDEEQ